MTMEIIKPGLLTTVQDAGRFGSQQYGVIVSGAVDAVSYQLANILLQQKDVAMLEFTLVGPTIRFTQPTEIALTGANFQPKLNNQPCKMWRPVAVQAGDVLKLGAAAKGARGYLACRGGVQVPDTLNSKSTYLRAALGGFQGRALEKGDVLPFEPYTASITRVDWSIDASTWLPFESCPTIRIMPSTEFDSFTKESIQQLSNAAYTISKDADRMGYRLEASAQLERVQHQELLSEAVTFGTIQVPPSGQPIILMVDRQTTGGYPKIAQVATVDLPKLAQCQPYQTIRFTWISVAHAQKLLIQQMQQLKNVEIAVKQKR